MNADAMVRWAREALSFDTLALVSACLARGSDAERRRVADAIRDRALELHREERNVPLVDAEPYAVTT